MKNNMSFRIRLVYSDCAKMQGFSNAAAFIEKTDNLIKQGQATAVNGLKVLVAGEHAHNIGSSENGSGAFPRGYYSTQHSVLSGYAGNHYHSLSGDTETRPTNYTVNLWLRTA
ncbi:hypothetical protein [Treponema sp. Marseille-Q4130]|uniref:hypothetical protein n=1 Tax=Treponema sp. Marseille-Q4130 TaxID=2766702 RepID=UPI00165254D9|nr:hypothetical protein [Treponema sp. Marseille-Q4130]MBC6720988.1 hypothetical protein [Treponema sp. Marseille-Q4130]